MKSKKIIISLSILTITSILMGTISAAFLSLLQLVTGLREQFHFLIVFLPLTGIATAFIYNKYGKNSNLGNNLIIESVQEERNVPLRMSILTFIFTIFTHLTGGSAGREGTAVQIGGALSNNLANYFKVEHKDKRIFVMAGISAAFGSVFGTPLAGAFFGMEMCYIGKISYEALLPCFFSSYIADYITRLFGITHTSYVIKSIPSLSLYNIIILILASCAFGFMGRVFAISVQALKKLYSNIIHNYLYRVVAGSLLYILVMVLLNAFKFTGLSTWIIQAGFDGKVTLLAPIKKLLLTVLTLGCGFQGGEVTPLFDIGASVGGYIGQITHIEPSLLAALGLISVFGCATNTPITSIMLGIEMFGVNAIPYYIIAALISYYVSGNSGIYSSQIIMISKYQTQTDIGQRLGAIGNKSIFHRVFKA